jgi:hypothetical protein
VAVVWSKTGLKKPYFRHIRVAGCPYALNQEYLLDTHWEIVDYMERLFQSKKRFSEIRRFCGLDFKEKLKLSIGKGKFLREIIMRAFGFEKRTDIVYKGYAIEVQCSPISAQEVRLREKVYRRFGLKTLWILGFPESVDANVHLSYPDNISIRKKIEMRKNRLKYHKWFKIIRFNDIFDENDHSHDMNLNLTGERQSESQRMSQDTILNILTSEIPKEKIKKTNYMDDATSLMFKGLKIEKWRLWLMEHSTVIGIYYKGKLHFNFSVFPWYVELPLHLKYPYRKEFLMVIKSGELDKLPA